MLCVKKGDSFCYLYLIEFHFSVIVVAPNLENIIEMKPDLVT